MRIPKKYGQSKLELCPFCQKQATTINKQKVPVCLFHKDEYLTLKCICGEYLDIKHGKFGSYCNCLNCGNINMKKAMEFN